MITHPKFTKSSQLIAYKQLNMEAERQHPIKGYVCVVGASGTGKTTLAEFINQRTKESGFVCYEGNLSHQGKQNQIDELGWEDLRASIENYRPGSWPVINRQHGQVPIYWFCLSAEIEFLLKRINNFPRTIRHTKKSLQYFTNVFKQMAYNYGMPILNTGMLSVKQLSQQIIQLISSGSYNKIQSFALSDLTSTKIQFMSQKKYLQFKKEQPTSNIRTGFKQYAFQGEDSFVLRQFISNTEENYFRTVLVNEALRRNGVDLAVNFVGNQGISINQVQQPVVWVRMSLSGKMGLINKKPEYTGPFIHLFTKNEGGFAEPIGTEQLQTMYNVNTARKQSFKLWFIISHYLSIVGFDLNQLSFGLDEDANLVQSTVLVMSKDRQGTTIEPMKTFLALLEYFKQHTFIAQYEQQWEVKPFEQQAKQFVNTEKHIPQCYIKAVHSLASPKHTYRAIMPQFYIKQGKPYVLSSQGIVPYNGTVAQALNQVSLFDDIIVTDCSENGQNRQAIKKIAKSFYIYSEGGVNTLDDLQDILSNSVRRLMIKYPQQFHLLEKIPPTRAILSLNVDEEGKIIVKGTTAILRDVLIESEKAYNADILCFTLPSTLTQWRSIKCLVRRLKLQVPDKIGRVFIRSNITTIDQITQLWSIGIIPIVSSPLWSSSTFISSVISSLPNYGPCGHVNCVILGLSGLLKGSSKVSRQAICRTVQTRQLFTCENNTLTSHFDSVKKISMSCDSNSVLFVVQSGTKFCREFDRYSCFRNQSIIKTNLTVVNDHIKGKIGSKSYSGLMQKNPGLALAKVMEEFWEIICADTEHQTNQCSDFLVHFLMYINGRGVHLEDILNELNARAYTPQIVPKFSKTVRDPNILCLGILSEKYFKSTDNFIFEQLGIKIIRPSQSRKLLIDYQVSDQQKYDRHFKGKRVSFLPMKSKDMPWLIAFGAIDGCITYSPVMDNYPKVSQCIFSRIVKGLRICLIKRRGDTITPSQWNKNNKAIIACEHVNYIHQYFIKSGIDQSSFTLNRIVGSSQSYLITKTNVHFCLCDAVVETGLTLEANDLEEWKTVVQDGQISVGLYLSLKLKS